MKIALNLRKRQKIAGMFHLMSQKISEGLRSHFHLLPHRPRRHPRLHHLVRARRLATVALAQAHLFPLVQALLILQARLHQAYQVRVHLNHHLHRVRLAFHHQAQAFQAHRALAAQALPLRFLHKVN